MVSLLALMVVEILFVLVPKLREEQKDCNGQQENGLQKYANVSLQKLLIPNFAFY